MKVNDRHVSFYYENDHDYGKIEIDPAKTALLIIDMQHVFITRPKLTNPTEEEKANAARWEQFYQAIDTTVVPNNNGCWLFPQPQAGSYFCQDRMP